MSVSTDGRCSVCGEGWGLSPCVGGTPTYREPQFTAAGWTCSACGVFVGCGSNHLCGAPGYGILPPPLSLTKGPHKCPACDGWGKRTKPNAHVDGTHQVKCPACNGKGLVAEVVS